MQPRWKPVPFAVSHILAGLLAASWLFAPTRVWWDKLDDLAFKMFNGFLALGETWQFFWALANHRAVDLLSAGLAAVIVVWWLWGAPRDVQNRRAAAFGALAIPVVLLPFLAHYAIENWLQFERYSPSVVYENAVRLTKLFPDLDTKDATIHSFPGDHAFVLFSLVLFYGYLAKRKFIIISTLLALIFISPRLMAGAHWLTDALIGGIVPALLVTAWVLATPAGYHLSMRLLPIVNRLVSMLPERLLIPEYTASGKRS